MQSWVDMSRRRKLAIGAIAVAVLAIAGVAAAQLVGGDEPVEKRPVRTQTETQPDAKPTGKTLDLGEIAKISADYTVAVTEVTRYEVPRGALMSATVKATYTGKADGEPWADLAVIFHRADGKTHDESDCPFDLGDLDPTDQPTLKADDEATYAVCIAVPTGSLKDGRISVEEAFANSGRAYWSIEGATTKPLPAPPADEQPSTTRFQGPNFPSKRGYDSEKLDENCEEFEEDYDGYLSWVRKMEKWYDDYRDAGGDDDETIEDFEEWKDDVREQRRAFDEWKEICDRRN